MKKHPILLIITGVVLLGFSYPAKAQDKITWGGYLQTDNRMRLKGDNDFSRHEYRLDLKAEVTPAEKTHFYSELWLRSWGIPDVQDSSDLIDKDKVAPWNLDLREAYVDLYGFLFNDLDIRMGRQRIAWGTGDKLNPTDNLNPPDLEDIWDFGRHLGSDGLKASYYPGDLTFTGVYIPIFTPAVSASGDWASALSPSIELPPGLTLGALSDTIILPDNNAGDGSTIGFKISKFVFDYDLSLSYVYGRDYLPMARKITFTPAGGSGTVDVGSELIYPRMQIAGIDMAGAIAGIGVWAEAAVFFPDKINLTKDLSALGLGIQEATALDNEPYVKYVIGTDYTFENGLYINGQWLHGFIHERGKDNLEDYLMFGIERKYFDDKLKIIPIAGGIEIKDYEDIENNYALIYMPEIAYYPVDNSEITLSARLIEGKKTTSIGKVKDNDEVYLKFKYSF
jgi:hypothetical protein